jgi:hypothetical protein
MLCYDQPNNPMTVPAAVPEIPAANIDKVAAYYINTLASPSIGGTNRRGAIEKSAAM